MPEPKIHVRVAQEWPSELRDAVRSVAGVRGVTRFTIEAVEEKLAKQGATVIETAVRSEADPDASTITAVEVPAQEVVHSPERGLGSTTQQEDVQDVPTVVRQSDLEQRERVLDDLAARRAQVLQEVPSLVPASSLPPPTPRCPTCGNTDLVDGECWACMI